MYLINFFIGVSNSFNDSEENNNLKTVFESPPLEYGDIFSQDLFLIKESDNEPINNNVKEYNNETQDTFEVKDDVNNTNQISTRQNEFSKLKNTEIWNKFIIIY